MLALSVLTTALAILLLVFGLLTFWIGGGVIAVILTAWFAPSKLRTLTGAFRIDVAVALIFIWPIPAFIGFLRVVTWPARRIAEKRSAAVDQGVDKAPA